MAVLDFIINYDIKYRMGSDAEGEGSWLRVSLTPPNEILGSEYFNKEGLRFLTHPCECRWPSPRCRFFRGRRWLGSSW